MEMSMIVYQEVYSQQTKSCDGFTTICICLEINNESLITLMIIISVDAFTLFSSKFTNGMINTLNRFVFRLIWRHIQFGFASLNMTPYQAQHKRFNL